MELAFTLILTFSGLCSFHIDKNDSIWALIVNNKCPSHVDFCELCCNGAPCKTKTSCIEPECDKKKDPRFEPHLPFLTFNSRNLKGTESFPHCQENDPDCRIQAYANEDGEAVISVRIDGLELEIEPQGLAKSSNNSLDIQHHWPGFTKKPWPWCKKDFRWTASIKDLYDDPESNPPELNRDCLNENPATCRSALSSRFRIDHGTVLSDALGRDEANDLIVWQLGEEAHQVLAEHVQIEVEDLRREVNLKLRALPGETDCEHGCTITLKPNQHKEVLTVGITNLPLDHKFYERQNHHRFLLDHFQWYYLLAEKYPNDCRVPVPDQLDTELTALKSELNRSDEQNAFKRFKVGEISATEYVSELSPETLKLLKRVPTDVFCPETRWP